MCDRSTSHISHSNSQGKNSQTNRTNRNVRTARPTEPASNLKAILFSISLLQFNKKVARYNRDSRNRDRMQSQRTVKKPKGETQNTKNCAKGQVASNDGAKSSIRHFQNRRSQKILNVLFPKRRLQNDSSETDACKTSFPKRTLAKSQKDFILRSFSKRLQNEIFFS